MKILLNKKTVKRVQDEIAKFDPKLKVIALNDTARSANDAASTLNCDVGAIVKSLLFKTDDSFIICLISGDKRCSLNKLKLFLDKKNVCMASAKEVKDNTGFSIGGVSPVGLIKKIDVIVDKSLNRFENIFAAAGHPNCVFKISYEQLVKITNGLEKEIVE
jgi:Cys-tRNA(Pro) deacylase